jgi:GTP-binding protein
MKIRTVEYAGTIAQRGGAAPGTLPQVAFSGRSNVGKSSLINTLLRRTRSKIAHVSARPGKTQALNFYRVNDEFFLVDLPGYGYARVPDAIRATWADLIDWYLGESGDVRAVVHLVDARHRPTQHDLRMVAYLAELRLPTLVVLTKIDKLKRAERAKSIRRAIETLEIDESQLLPFSSATGEGRSELLQALDDIVHGGRAPDSEAAEQTESGNATASGVTSRDGP